MDDPQQTLERVTLGVDTHALTTMRASLGSFVGIIGVNSERTAI
jgi:hypothetical protein